ncbi:MAG: hypothetical protein AAF517_20010 [Planctomycetota bacterium]
MRSPTIIALSVFAVWSHGSFGLGQERLGGIVPRGGEDPQDAWQELGDVNQAKGWSGLESSPEGGKLPIPGTSVFTYEQGRDWSNSYGIRLDITIPSGRKLEARLTLRTPDVKVKSSYKSQSTATHASLSILGNGRESIDVPLSAFDHFYPFQKTMRSVKSLEIQAKFGDGREGAVLLHRARLVRAPVLKLSATTRSLVGEAGEVLEYEFRVVNCSDRSQAIALSHSPYSKHVMTATVEPKSLTLAPAEVGIARARIRVSDRVPPGGRERQKVVAFANGTLGGAIEFITGRKLTHPYLVHTKERWEAVRKKIEKYDWARDGLSLYTNHKTRDQRPGSRWPYAVAWQLTRDRKFAEQAKRGITAKVGGKDLIQAAEIYDMIYDSGVLSEGDKKRIEAEFRNRMRGISLSGVANLELQEARCGFTLALAVQDFAWLEHFLYAADGVYDNIANGIMPDGWWYEGSVNYNVWVSRYICKMALAAEPFGYNLPDHYFTRGPRSSFAA